jgi:hypothetical protein
MDGIPPALDTDVEDVVWALQTADALWKRNERGDALVWLRRAAQTAAEANDDDRALVLARNAAELTESMAQPSAPPGPRLPAAGSLSPEALGAVKATPPKRPIEPRPPPDPASAEAPAPTPVVPVGEASKPPPAQSGELPKPAVRVPTAAESHAGMLDPWADADRPHSSRRSGAQTPAGSAAPFDDEEVVTSAKPPPVRTSPPKPSPPKVAPRAARTSERVAVAAIAPPVPPLAVPAPAAVPAPPAPAAVPFALDLSRVDPFVDLPDDVRSRFALAAKVSTLTRGEQIATFGLAFIHEGEAAVLAEGRSGVAVSLPRGSVLRSKGTLAAAQVPMRLCCASETATIATWAEADVDGIAGPCPWVEDDFRAAADRVQALAGLSLGPLGQVAYAQVRSVLASRLMVKALVAGEAFLHEGDAVHGLALVGCGQIDVTGGDGEARVLAPGAFVFPAETLSMGRAGKSATAGAAGAVLLHADRSTTQELLVTQPLLLELLASA